MRSLSVTIAAATALLSVSAYAQTTTPVHPTSPGIAPATSTPAPATPKPNPLDQSDVTKIIGASVYSSDGKDVGDLSTVLMEPDSKKINKLVVHSGGVLGMGGRYVALPVSDFSWDGMKNAFTIKSTENDLKAMAEWKPPASGSSGVGTTASSPPPSNTGVGSGSSQKPKSAGSSSSESGH
jgi:sporulation protein YlmC with PRC-barrel domain